MKVLVTGASGFVGTTLCAELQSRGHDVSAAVRRAGSAPSGTREILVGDINETTNWSEALRGQNAVIHLAARVHVMTETADDPSAEFRRVNTAGTLGLAKAAQQAKIQKFVFLSSIKANGEATTTKPFSVNDSPNPQDAYGVSKLEAENELNKLAESGSTKFTAIRTPLVYGPGVGGNFLRLIKLVDQRFPIPLAGVQNRRTMVSIWNLADLIDYVLAFSGPRTQLILAGDSENLSTAQIVRSIGVGLRKPTRLFWLPLSIVSLLGRLVGKSPEVQRIIGSLEVRVGSTAEGFAWSPPDGSRESISRAAYEWNVLQDSDA